MRGFIAPQRLYLCPYSLAMWLSRSLIVQGKYGTFAATDCFSAVLAQ
jgi:hypothetical protein